jgi:hypothetical protein
MTEINKLRISDDTVIEIIKDSYEETIKLLKEQYELLLAEKQEQLTDKDKEIIKLKNEIEEMSKLLRFYASKNITIQIENAHK